MLDIFLLLLGHRLVVNVARAPLLAALADMGPALIGPVLALCREAHIPIRDILRGIDTRKRSGSLRLVRQPYGAYNRCIVMAPVLLAVRQKIGLRDIDLRLGLRLREITVDGTVHLLL